MHYTETIKQKLLTLFDGYPQTQEYLNKIIGFPFTSQEQKRQAWKIAGRIVMIEFEKKQIFI